MTFVQLPATLQRQKSLMITAVTAAAAAAAAVVVVVVVVVAAAAATAAAAAAAAVVAVVVVVVVVQITMLFFALICSRQWLLGSFWSRRLPCFFQSQNHFSQFRVSFALLLVILACLNKKQGWARGREWGWGVSACGVFICYIFCLCK